ncbi:MAG: phosphatidate cytidylyltransferase [Bdellovibrionaceae bacterium]|nr:phosphatidate cytidylyltransferase [Pseudobdellovibrionaceae bacterium]
MTNFLLRAFSALIALIVLVTTLSLFGLNGAIVLITLVAPIIASEISGLFSTSKVQAASFALLSATSLLLHFFYSEFFNSYLIFFLAFALVPWINRNKSITESYQTLTALFYACFYSFIAPVYIFSIMSFGEETYFKEFYFLILLVFGADTVAYLCGKTLGRRFFQAKFQPLISPSKTLEGLVGALIWPFLLCGVLQYFDLAQFPLIVWGILALTNFVAISGDLVVSLMKRNFNKKDTSQLMPGHGGLLDRTDSLLLSAPFFYWSLSYWSF